MVTAVHVVLPLVFTYILVEVDEPSDLRYKEPLAADKVGAPDPKNTPKFEVLENIYPLPVVPPAGIDV